MLWNGWRNYGKLLARIDGWSRIFTSVLLLQPICPAKTCAGCPVIPSCEAPKTRLLQFGPDLDVLPVTPPCPERTVAEPTRPPTIRGAAGSSKMLCPAMPKRYYDDSYVY